MAMQLRRWQSEASTEALRKFRAGHQHFLCLATPGAGKTLMASIVARELCLAGDVDLVFCLSPSVNVSTTFQASLERHIGGRLDGRLGSKGFALTYHAMLNLDDTFWSLLSRYRIFVIFDEIHHCAGDQLENANAWGQRIIQKIQGRAAYTLALTGTPWRSDKIPIALASYCREGKVVCDYAYGLDDAITDGVCRMPRITAIDNGKIAVKTGLVEERFSSFSELLEKSKCTYQHIIDNTVLISYLLKVTAKKLNQIRRQHDDAGALIVAASVEHALKIADILCKETGESARIATYMHDDAQETIANFRNSREKWIISVGMISEGTDIPRLRVCCHLTRVKTELYFRQVLGRILRSNGQPHDIGYLFMPAEPNLVEFAQRVTEDVPNATAVSLESMGASPAMELCPTGTGDADTTANEGPEIEEKVPVFLNITNVPLHHSDTSCPTSTLADAYDATVGLFGRFKERIIHPGILGGINAGKLHPK